MTILGKKYADGSCSDDYFTIGLMSNCELEIDNSTLHHLRGIEHFIANTNLAEPKTIKIKNSKFYSNFSGLYNVSLINLISDLEIQNNEFHSIVTNDPTVGVYISNNTTKQILIQNNLFKNYSNSGVNASNCFNLKINTMNRFENNGNGVRTLNSAANISDNTFTNNTWGSAVFFVSSNTSFFDNVVNHSRNTTAIYSGNNIGNSFLCYNNLVTCTQDSRSIVHGGINSYARINNNIINTTKIAIGSENTTGTTEIYENRINLIGGSYSSAIYFQKANIRRNVSIRRTTYFSIDS